MDTTQLRVEYADRVVAEGADCELRVAVVREVSQSAGQIARLLQKNEIMSRLFEPVFVNP